MINNEKYMCGLVEGALYSLYITNMKLVWQDAPSIEQVHRKALQKGLTDFDHEKRRILISNLATAVRESCGEVTFSFSSPLLIRAKAKISETLSWNFGADLCDPQKTATFYRDLCFQMLANHSYSLFREHQLENLVRVRDDYTLYLEENYKTVNGTELMDKYRRQHPDSAKLLERDSKSDLDSKMTFLYSDYLGKSKAQNPQSWPWKDLELMARRQEEWANALQAMPKDLSLLWQKSSAELTPRQIYATSQKRSRSHSDEDIPSKLWIKLEPDSEKDSPVSQSLSPSRKISPTKRKRLGYLGRR